MVLEKTLESPLGCKEINQSILKEISHEYSLEGLMLKVKLKDPFSLEESYDKPRHVKKQRHYFSNKGPSSQSYGFSSMDVRAGVERKLSAEELMLLNCGVGKDSWSPLDCKEIKPVNPKGNQS